MSDLTTRLALPVIAPSQAQKHVTHNEALQRLDLLVQMRIAGFDAIVPPQVPEPGLIYALGDGATAAWAGQDGRLAVFLDNAWLFLDPQPCWLAVEAESGMIRIYRDGTWRAGPERLSRLGLGTPPDPNNRLAVAARATLLSHAGGDHRLAINKASAPDTASLLFQTGFSGRAEMGLAGGDDWSIKVSVDGSDWIEALRVDAASGRVTGQAVQSAPEDTTPGRLMRADFGYGPGNVLGTVSQSGGVPTGAIIERGSNANGDYVRFADGTQECWFNDFQTLADAAATWTFPASFVAGTAVAGAHPITAANLVCVPTTVPDATNVNYRSFEADTGDETRSPKAMVWARGRWF